MTPPVRAVRDGAQGFWKAVREVFPETKEQRCWFHLGGNVLAALPKSAHPGAKITDHLDVLLVFYDYPTEHWIHLRKTNPIESTLATVRLRQRVTKGPGSRAAGVARAFELIESAQACWRTVNAPHLVAQVRAGATFEKGKLVERPEESGGDKRVA